MSQTVLVVEDDPKIVNLLGLYLKREGFNVASAADGREALDAATRIRPSLIILDLMLPHMDGVEVCRRLRAASDVPILMLTARVDELDKLLGLSLGADDYVTKPFSPREVVARSLVLQRGSLEMDLDRHRVTVGGVEVDLTPVEFRLLQTLLESPERAFTRDQLLNHIYAHHEAAVVDRAIDVHVGKVRQKLGDDPDHPRFIATVRGVGYKLL
ncbi:MAG: response regulator transcription factor [Bacillati bacterium ANGP1]|uniref:Response regulator transcription factor n=1 Tax=Candidatus Segetimicrobium genomatis TaxID=2569760 RepID=A0A537LIQ6_9BACT|nr:MAG: response regulator transcription factor [Terrabacteria group bacterium ANGP1]